MFRLIYCFIYKLRLHVTTRGKISFFSRIQGDINNITFGENVVVEPFASLSTKHGGKIVIGKNSVIRSHALISTHGGNICIGENSGVNNFSIIYGHGGVKIGDFVRIAAHSVIIPANHGTRLGQGTIYSQPLTKEGIEIENDVWIGANVTILDGSSIRSGCVIAAGSAGKFRTEENAIYGGVPGRFLKKRHEN